MSIVCLSHVMRHADAKLGARLVLFVLAEHAHDDGTEAYPAIDTICERTRMSRRGVQAALRKLETDGEISRDGVGSKGQTKWAIRMGGAESAPRAESDIGGCRIRPGGGEATSPEPSIEPSIDPVRLSAREPAVLIFDAWVTATGRNPHRTKLTPDRRRCIDKAHTSHGLDDCLAAVQHIGADDWARGNNDRQTRFDDIQHALGSTERIERWRDQQPRQANVTPIHRDRLTAREELAEQRIAAFHRSQGISP